MASLYKENNAWVIQFASFEGNRKRPKVWLGKMPKKTAETMLSRIEEMISCRLAGHSLSPETSAWLGKLPDDTLAKFAKVGLVTFQRHTIGELWTAFRKQKRGVSQSTLDVYDYAEHRLFSYFDRKTGLRELSPEHFENWKTFLLTEYRNPRTDKPLVEATVAGSITKVKAVINWAIRNKWITKEQNPLEGVSRGSFINRDKDREVTVEEYYRLLEACPCQEWRVIIALARIGGLRPCEMLRLRWADVAWGKFWIRVTSTKAERYEGKAMRDVPLFQELRIELERLFKDESSKGKEFVINRYRKDSNMRQQFSRIVKMADVNPIPRPFDNMRASRSTEVYVEFGAFYESKWIGHSRKIAEDCYFTVRELDFKRAANWETVTLPEFAPVQFTGQHKERPKTTPVQIPVQHASESSRTELRKNEKTPQFAGSNESVQVDATAHLPKRGH